jgi:NAD(P)-dependent dehydrogenase (short-subunit alcohol dehydrogenase family)
MKARTLLLLAAAAGAGAAARQAAKKRRFSFRNKVALVTGGSRGLGLALARELATEGACLALVARKSEELERAAVELRKSGATVLTLAADLTSEEEVSQLVLATVERFGRIDVLINNAGIMQVGPFDTMSPKDYEEAMDIHYWAPLRLVLECLPHLRVRPEARIVNIASIGGVVAAPHMLPYSGSKFALVGLSEGMRSELAAEGILVTTVCPGLMRTGSVRQVNFKGEAEKEKTWFALAASAPLLSVSVETAARKIVEAARVGRPFLTFTPLARLGIPFHALMPNLTSRILGLVSRLLPRSSGVGSRAIKGSELPTRYMPAFQRRVMESAEIRNNQRIG